MFPVMIYGNAQCFSCALLLSHYPTLTPAGLNMSGSRNFHLLSGHLFAVVRVVCVFSVAPREAMLSAYTLGLILIKSFFLAVCLSDFANF